MSTDSRHHLPASQKNAKALRLPQILRTRFSASSLLRGPSASRNRRSRVGAARRWTKGISGGQCPARPPCSSAREGGCGRTAGCVGTGHGRCTRASGAASEARSGQRSRCPSGPPTWGGRLGSRRSSRSARCLRRRASRRSRDRCGRRAGRSSGEERSLGGRQSRGSGRCRASRRSLRGRDRRCPRRRVERRGRRCTARRNRWRCGRHLQFVRREKSRIQSEVSRERVTNRSRLTDGAEQRERRGTLPAAGGVERLSLQSDVLGIRSSDTSGNEQLNQYEQRCEKALWGWHFRALNLCTRLTRSTARKLATRATASRTEA